MTNNSPPNDVPETGTGLHCLPRNVWEVTATSLLTDISSEMLVHLLPLFLANVLGARATVIGLIEGVRVSRAGPGLVRPRLSSSAQPWRCWL